MRRTIFAAALACLALPVPVAMAQGNAATLADIRQELSMLYVEVRRLGQELNTTGVPSGTGGTSGDLLARIDAIEAELQRLTGKTEQLEFRVDSIVRDGTNRIGDLEFRLCELETDCDIAALGDTPLLGGAASAGAPMAPSTPPQPGFELAMGEEADFKAATEALEAQEYVQAALLFEAFNETYPNGPLAVQAHIGRGEALSAQGLTKEAARAYLEAFSFNPQGDNAPAALFRLGRSLAVLGQTTEACVTLQEVGVRFPGDMAAKDAQAEMQTLGCL